MVLFDDLGFHFAEVTTGFGVGAASVGDTSWVTAAGAGILRCPARQGFVFFSGGFQFALWWRNGDGCAQMIGGPQADIPMLHLANVATIRTVAGGYTNSGFAVGAGVAIFELVLHILG